VRQADRIAVVDNGRIAELGTHDELMDPDGPHDGLYRHMYDLQASRFTDDGPQLDEHGEEMTYDRLS